ncbi:MAG: hypothetical protein PVG89_05480 [Gammaproteobacteria bacterium]|jgi:hypothetical protein
MKLSKLIFAFVTMTVVSLPVVAGDSEREKYFNELDENNNQVLDISEVEDNTPLLHDFPKIDKDGNNELDMSEFSAFEPMKSYRPIPPKNPEPGAAPTE